MWYNRYRPSGLKIPRAERVIIIELVEMLTEEQQNEIYKLVKRKKEKEWRKNRSEVSKEKRKAYNREYMRKYNANKRENQSKNIKNDK